MSKDEWALWSLWVQAHRVLMADVDKALQEEVGISKADFSILRTLRLTPEGRLRVSELAASLQWEKSRVAHQLTRMEQRGLLARVEGGASGRRTAVMLTERGRALTSTALLVHGRAVRRVFLDRTSDGEAATLRRWSASIVASTDASAPED